MKRKRTSRSSMFALLLAVAFLLVMLALYVHAATWHPVDAPCAVATARGDRVIDRVEREADCRTMRAAG